jgi:hypothetical protein
MAEAYAMRGGKDEAFKWLNRAYDDAGGRGCRFHACRPVIPADAGPSFHTMPGRV